MSLQQYDEAARTAVIIAKEEQNMGNYRTAHELLLKNHMQLKKANLPIPADLTNMLVLLHSYSLIKVF